MSGSLLAGVIVALLPFARKRGVDRFVITHPEFLIEATPEELREMIRQGAYLEHEAGFWVANPPAGRSLSCWR